MGRSARKRISDHSIALCSRAGGLFGMGLGQSRQKFFYLPEPQTDFIFAILSEELGFIGGTLILLLFSVLLWRGIRIALGAPDLYGSFVAVGIISMIAIQVMINIGVVTSTDSCNRHHAPVFELRRLFIDSNADGSWCAAECKPLFEVLTNVCPSFLSNMKLGNN